jgi:anthranilate synthase component I
MSLLTFRQFTQYAKKGNLVPLVKDLILDCETPVSTFVKVSSAQTSTFLLESVEYGERIGRYSLIGHDPELLIEKKGNAITVTDKKKTRSVVHDTDDVFVVLKQIMAEYQLVLTPDVPSFCGGFVGYCSYENVATFEDISFREKESLGFIPALFFFATELIVFDHLDKKVKIIVLAHIKKSLRAAYTDALGRIQRIERSITHNRTYAKKKQPKKVLTPAIKSNMTRPQFEAGVRKIRRYIKAGDAIQVVLSQRFDLGTIENEFNIYRALRTVNPSPYMFFFKHKGTCLIGSSPEMLVKKEGLDVQVRPIAGTRKRGVDQAADTRLAGDLTGDEKENAEHLMLVDLGRNDLGRVCDYSSIKVTDYARIERYSHVMHLVSEVHGRLGSAFDVFDLVRATFPAGTLSGAPKIRAMEIIDEIEPDERGPYGGCLGYISLNGDCNMCITIRTIMVKDKHAYLQAGAGIVYDSKPAREYMETLNKARALMQAVEVSADLIM